MNTTLLILILMTLLQVPSASFASSQCRHYFQEAPVFELVSNKTGTHFDLYKDGKSILFLSILSIENPHNTQPIIREINGGHYIMIVASRSIVTLRRLRNSSSTQEKYEVVEHTGFRSGEAPFFRFKISENSHFIAYTTNDKGLQSKFNKQGKLQARKSDEISLVVMSFNSDFHLSHHKIHFLATEEMSRFQGVDNDGTLLFTP